MNTIFYGSRNNAVLTAQKAINLHGFGPIVADAIFGHGTKSAVIQFQQANGLAADGIVGPDTWSVLLAGPGKKLKPTNPWKSKRDTLQEIVDGNPSIPAVVREALTAAISDIGLREVPLGSNSGSQISNLTRGYGPYWGIEERGYPWCAIAVSVWTARGLGLGQRGDSIDWSQHPFGHWYGGVAQIVDWATKQNRTEDTPQPGHIFTMPRAGSNSDPSTTTRAGHCGLVVEGGDTVTTVEGNTSNRVDTRERPLDGLTFIRWW